jgi:hypothetical protein
MKTTAQQFRDNPNKSVTLLGMSGVGKTTFSSKLPSTTWYHYSGDYRIGTKYLDEPILDETKRIAMQNPRLRDLLLSDSIYIRNNITIDHLHPISSFLGKIGNPELGGLSVDEFKRRQALFREAEIRSMEDAVDFMNKARDIYGYPHFLNDAGGSICGLSDRECWDSLSRFTVILYLRTSDDLERTLLERAKKKPKPMFYESAFLDSHLERYIQENDYKSADDINPDQFVQWVFPELVSFRKPQYEHIANKYGHTIEAEKISELRDEQDIIDLICDNMDV